MKTHGLHDPALYRELSAPRPDPSSAEAGLQAFAEEFRELRKKHRIPDVLWMAAVNATTEDGERHVCMMGQFGSSEMSLALGKALLATVCATERAKVDAAEGGAK